VGACYYHVVYCRFLPAFIQLKKKLEDNYLGSPITLIDIRVQSGSLFTDMDAFDWKCDSVMGGKTIEIFFITTIKM